MMMRMFRKAKETQTCVIKRMLKFNDCKNCLFKNEILLRFHQIFKSETRCVYTEEVNKITLSSNDDKRLQTFDRIRTYPYGTNAFKVCKSEMLGKYKWLILIIILMKIEQNIIHCDHIFLISHIEY